jgi:hypothetical protein
LNFGKTPELKRVIFTNDRKERFDSETDEYYFFNPNAHNPACSLIHFMIEAGVGASYY